MSFHFFIFPFLWFLLSMFSSPFINIFQHMSLSLPQPGLFLSILCDFKIYIFLTFLFWYFIVSVKKCNRFLYVNPVSCYLADRSSSFCVESSRFFIQSIMPYAYNDSYLFPSNLDAFYLFFLSDYCGQNFKYYVKQKCETRHPCLVPDFRGTTFSFSLLSVILAASLL